MNYFKYTSRFIYWKFFARTNQFRITYRLSSASFDFVLRICLFERNNWNNWNFHPQYYLLGYGERSVESDWQENLQLVITKLEQFSNSKHRPSFFSAPDSMDMFLILTSQSVKEKKVKDFFIEKILEYSVCLSRWLCDIWLIFLQSLNHHQYWQGCFQETNFRSSWTF